MGDVIAIALIGLVGGAASGLLGIGGGTLFVPAMVLILGKDQHLAQGVSLVVIIPTAISATLANTKGGYVDVPAARWVTPFAVVFALAGGFTAGLLDGPTLSRIFGVMVLYVGTRTLFTTWRTMRRERAAERQDT
ncbi:MAG: sulfite exporter TauE/SafE family protein [Chloroflexi bacterium]|nr:sulfite exporter TauE/SafE family protein [Chloroflexota bacterium]MDA1239737.1 sulfite exporter TauE/SafE family protein [Chloroflexota bacterium]